MSNRKKKGILIVIVIVIYIRNIFLSRLTNFYSFDLCFSGPAADAGIQRHCQLSGRPFADRHPCPSR